MSYNWDGYLLPQFIVPEQFYESLPSKTEIQPKILLPSIITRML